MPKYVFEVSGKLPAGQQLNQLELLSLSAQLAAELIRASKELNKPLAAVEYDEPFEHVYGPDATPIDL